MLLSVHNVQSDIAVTEYQQSQTVLSTELQSMQKSNTLLQSQYDEYIDWELTSSEAALDPVSSKFRVKHYEQCSYQLNVEADKIRDYLEKRHQGG